MEGGGGSDRYPYLNSDTIARCLARILLREGDRDCNIGAKTSTGVGKCGTRPPIPGIP